MLNRIVFCFFLLTPLLSPGLLAGPGQIDSLKAVRLQMKEKDRMRIDEEIARLYMPLNRDSAVHYLNRLRRYLSYTEDPLLQAQVYKLEGSLHMRTLDYDSAMSKYRDAYMLFKEFDDKEEMGWTARGIGRAYFYLGSYDNAMEYFLMSLSAFELAENQEGTARIHNNLGAVCYLMGHTDKAIEYYESALDIFRNLDDKKHAFRIYNNLGIIYFDQEAYEKALEFYFRAEKILLNSDNPGSLARTYNNIAVCYSNLNKMDTAMRYIRSSLKLAEEASNRYTAISARLNLGVIHSRMNQPDSALYYLLSTRAESDSLKLKSIAAECYNELALHYERYGDYRSAFEAHEKYFDLHQAIHNENSQSRIDMLMSGYEQKIRQQELSQLKADQETQALVNKIFALLIGISLILLIILVNGYSNKRKRNRLLHEKNEQLKDVNERMTQSETTLKRMIEDNNKLFSIVAHDLRNPVAAVSGFSELLNENYDHLDAATRKEYLSQIIQGSNRTHDLLENMLLWARSQMNAVKIRKKPVSVQQLVGDSMLSVQIAFDHKRIRLETSYEENFVLDVDQEMIKAVVRNLLTNAAKFSFPDSVVEIRCYRSDGLGCIEVRDHGIGMQAETLSGIFSDPAKNTTPGTSGESGSGLGLIICKDYTEISGGTISAESQPGKGSTFTICLPIAE
jgi:signal transduction histidine kinase/Tfp pilus assembly protein PilF